MKAETLRAQLAKVGKRRAAAMTAKQCASDELRELIPLAIEAGVGPTEIARLTGVSRQGVENFRKPLGRPSS
jgi:hypothetical protein